MTRNNEYTELKGLFEVFPIKAGSLVKIVVNGAEIKGVLGLYDEGIADILTPVGVKGISLYWNLPPVLHYESHERLDWYKQNREDIFSRLKLLEKIK